jgi:4-amino-4-deoxychorismate lyase
MYPVFESIAVMDGSYLNVPGHMARMQRTAKALWNIDLPDNYLKKRLPVFTLDGLYKCRFMYNADGFAIEFRGYNPNYINQLILTEVPHMAYEFKYTDRSEINNYISTLDKGIDVLFTRNGYLMDTSYCNVALLKEGIWYTPETPLLCGTQRAVGIEAGVLQLALIHRDDLSEYECITMFNAFNAIGKVCLPCSAIVHLP